MNIWAIFLAMKWAKVPLTIEIPNVTLLLRTSKLSRINAKLVVEEKAFYEG